MKSHKPERHAALHASGSFPSALNGPVVEAMERQASLMSGSFRLLQEEGLQFMTRRLEENAKAAKEFTTCKSLPELFAAQQRWFAEMMRAYSEEWTRCGQLMSGALNPHQAQTDDDQRPRRAER